MCICGGGACARGTHACVGVGSTKGVCMRGGRVCVGCTYAFTGVSHMRVGHLRMCKGRDAQCIMCIALRVGLHAHCIMGECACVCVFAYTCAFSTVPKRLAITVLDGVLRKHGKCHMCYNWSMEIMAGDKMRKEHGLSLENKCIASEDYLGDVYSLKKASGRCFIM